MSPLQIDDRLRELANEIRCLRAAILNLDRTANDLSGKEEACIHAGAEAFVARARLTDALDQYFNLAEAVRAGACPIHGKANPHLHACLDCMRALANESTVRLKSA